MTQKTFKSKAAKEFASQLDSNGDNEIDDLEIMERKIRLENDNAKQDQQRYMVKYRDIHLQFAKESIHQRIILPPNSIVMYCQLVL